MLTSKTPHLTFKAALSIALAVQFASTTQTAHGRALGIDVSNNNGPVTWSSVANAGKVFAWAKATEGTGFTDAYYSSNIRNGKNAGLYMAGYDFVHPESNTPGAEENHFWAVAGGDILADGKTLMPMCDFEVFSGHVGATSYSDWANQFNKALASDAKNAGVKITPFLYTSSCSACNFNSSIQSWNADLANYNGQSSQTGTPWSACSSCNVWGAWDVWQYSQSGSVSGVSGNCDLDVYNGTAAQVNDYLVATSTASQVTNPKDYNSPVTYLSDGRMQFFSVDNGALRTIWKNTDNTWSSWQNLGGTGLGLDPTCGKIQPSGRMQIFVQGPSSTVRTIYKQTDGTWSAWQNLGGSCVSQPTVGYLPDGRLQIFTRSTANTIQTMWKQTDGTWSSWQDLGGTPQSAIGVGYLQDGRLQIFWRTSNSDMATQWKSQGGAWSDIQSLGGTCYSDPGVGYLPDGSMQIFVRNSVNDVGTIWKQSDGTWSNWQGLSGNCYVRVQVGYLADGRMQIFTHGQLGDVWTLWKNTDNTWSSWQDLNGNSASAVWPGNLPDGRFQLFTKDSNGVVKTAYKDTTGAWTGWSSL